VWQREVMAPPLQGVLETCLYADDLATAAGFYARVLGAEPFLEEASRHVFMRMGGSLVFLFRPEASRVPTPEGKGLPIPTHGATGPGHVAWSVDLEDLEAWRRHLMDHGVPIEEEIEWPHGARSLYFRDPAGNSLELATRSLWAEVLDAPGGSVPERPTPPTGVPAREIAATPWLRLCEVDFTDCHGRAKTWSFAQRTGTGRAVAVIAETDEPEPRLVLVKEFRPPVGRAVLAFPAGLVDEGESIETAALRELKEETGWSGELLNLSPACYSSPGLTDENLHFARVRLHAEGEPAPEVEEAIEVLLWPRHELRERLAEAAAEGVGVDVKIWAFARGLSG
jgi:8-oxo-dGTP pyrophosphatase MutT (NUDIX family)/catechol 2,3-dioxygenase-like lactoylglutathione lyase family enzyme